ncbi:helix-turn-helix transcriptional regulator [Raoultibacter phocaeensis]|uniref:helix-turn-helix transcriptional regulator n=1 Tax=Raoultibacter phocaeensis TaxID=2479841 RepID=UPI0015D597E0|nr:helix-turn-helix transcriptional regulator [Raoultibacter phocaeensis]
MSAEVFPRQSLSSALLLVAVGGFSLFWAVFLSMLMRNSFLDVDIENLWHHLVLRIAFFIGFGLCSFALSRTADGTIGKRRRGAMYALVVLFSVIAAASSASYFVTQTAHALPFDLVAWALSGIGLCCLFFLWIEAVAAVSPSSTVKCLALSVVCGSGFYLIITMLPSPFNIAMLAVCPLISLGILKAMPQSGEQPEAAEIPLSESKKNAHLSGAFGAIYVIYGIVFGLGAGSITQIAGDATLFVGIAALTALGALAAFGFMTRFSGRIEQGNMLKMVFPFLVIALVPMSFMSDMVYALCNLLLMGAYVFLLLSSIAFELQTARARRASYLFFVGMSQTALSAGLAVGYGLGLLASGTGAVNLSVLSGIALGLVVLLAAFVTFAPIERPLMHEAVAPEAQGDAQQDEADTGDRDVDHEQGHWKASCTALAERYGLSPRETEVFFYLAKGRGIEHIQNQLYISSHTVKTHTYNIYRKMNIGSREELLDLIEAEKQTLRGE